MMSVLNVPSGAASLKTPIFLLYLSALYPRCMTRSILSEPDCTGRWSLLTIVSFWPMAVSVRSSMFEGWLVVKETRGALSATASSRSQKRSPSCRQASTVWPRSVTYFVPESTSRSTSESTLSLDRQTILPLTEGTMQ